MGGPSSMRISNIIIKKMGLNINIDNNAIILFSIICKTLGIDSGIQLFLKTINYLLKLANVFSIPSLEVIGN